MRLRLIDFERERELDAMKWDRMVPFVDGVMVDELPTRIETEAVKRWADRYGDRLTWLSADPFAATLRWLGMVPGGARLVGDGLTFYITRRTLAVLIPDMVNGEITGRWEIRKRGRRFTLEREGQAERRRCLKCRGSGRRGEYVPSSGPFAGLEGGGWLSWKDAGKCRTCWGSGRRPSQTVRSGGPE